MARDTGNGATIAFSAGAFAARLTSIELGDKTREALDDSGLDTTNFAEMLPGDLWRHSPITVNALADPAATNTFVPPEAVVTMTVTLPNQGAANAATYAASGFVTQVTFPTLQNDTLQAVSFQFQPDGKGTEPTFTADPTPS